MLRSLKGLYHLVVAIVANIWFGFPGKRLTVVGVTGTDGKTTTTSIIYEILKQSGIRASKITSVHATIAGKDYDTGFHVTTPTAWWVQKYLKDAADHGDTHMVLEVTSHALSQYRVFGVPFSVGVITNVTHEHLDWHKTFESYLATKLTLLTQAGTAVVNMDEPVVYDAAVDKLRGKRVITYGISKQADVNPSNHPFTTKLPGTFNRYNVLAALAVADALGIYRESARQAVSRFTGVRGRMEVLSEAPIRVIVDFAHTPNAIEKALAATREMTKQRIIHVFGSAGLRDRSKRPLMGKASSQYSDVIILTEEDFRTENVNDIMDEIARGIPHGKEILRFPNRLDALRYAVKIARSGDTIIATGKGHEKSLARGTIEHAWSDQDELKKLIRAKK